jgi:membrane dipeptidase
MTAPEETKAMNLRRIPRRALLGAALAGPVFGAFGSAAQGPAASVSDRPGIAPDPVFLAKARTLLARAGAADLHAHPGALFSMSAESPGARVAADQVAADLKAGFVTSASFAAVADAPVLAMTPTGITVARDFRPGEAQADYQSQVATLKAAAKAGGIILLKSPKDLQTLVPGRDAGVFLTVEGGDFLEDEISRLTGAFQDGVRCVTLIHYRPNALGDNQTSPPTHGGLTPLGAEAVREMNRLGLLIDVAHAAETTVRQVLERSAAPILCSHTAIKSPAYDHPRFITAATAKAVAAAGGLVGAWPSGFGAVTFSDFVDRIFRLTEVVGPDHAALGTDMDGNYKPVMTRYAQVPVLVSELLRRGYGEANAEKFIGGNFRRVWGQVWRG